MAWMSRDKHDNICNPAFHQADEIHENLHLNWKIQKPKDSPDAWSACVCVCVCTKTIAVAHINCRHCILLKKIFMEVTRKGRLREVVHAKATSLKYHLDIYKHSNQRISKWKRSCFINFCLFFLSLSRSRCR